MDRHLIQSHDPRPLESNSIVNVVIRAREVRFWAYTVGQDPSDSILKSNRFTC